MVSPNPLTNRSSQPVADSQPRVGAVARLRRALFANAAEVGRYGIGFDRLLEHLWRVRSRTRRFSLRAVRHPGDLVHVIACIDGVGTAWHDLAERYESALVRVGHSVSAHGRSVVLARRLLADLRGQCHHDTDAGRVTLRDYHGEVPLRRWLTHRLVARVHLAGQFRPRRTPGLHLVLPDEHTSAGDQRRESVETVQVDPHAVSFSAAHDQSLI